MTNVIHDRYAEYKPTTPMARFRLHDHHEVIIRHGGDKGSTATCDTCSLSATIAAACVFAYRHGIINMTVDGAPLKRI